MKFVTSQNISVTRFSFLQFFCVREKKKKKVQMTVSPFWVIAGRREVSFLYHCLLMVGCPLRELLQTLSSRDCHVASEGHKLGIFL